jgi:hypothetical protein
VCVCVCMHVVCRWRTQQLCGCPSIHAHNMCFVQYTSAVSRFFVQHSAGGSQQLGCSCCCCCGRPCKWLLLRLLLLLLLRPPLGQHCCTPACRSVPAGRSMVVTVGDVYCQVLYCVQALAWFPVAVDVHSHLPPCTMVLSEPRCPLRGVQSCPDYVTVTAHCVLAGLPGRWCSAPIRFWCCSVGPAFCLPDRQHRHQTCTSPNVQYVLRRAAANCFFVLLCAWLAAESSPVGIRAEVACEGVHK